MPGDRRAFPCGRGGDFLLWDGRAGTSFDHIHNRSLSVEKESDFGPFRVRYGNFVQPDPGVGVGFLDR